MLHMMKNERMRTMRRTFLADTVFLDLHARRVSIFGERWRGGVFRSLCVPYHPRDPGIGEYCISWT
jgi:hypothetical protein